VAGFFALDSPSGTAPRSVALEAWRTDDLQRACGSPAHWRERVSQPASFPEIAQALLKQHARIQIELRCGRSDRRAERPETRRGAGFL
jgi:hypothetical protein